MLRRFLVVLVFIFFVVLVLFPVLFGGYLAFSAGGDAEGAAIMSGLLVAGLIVLATDVLLMVSVLALWVATRDESDSAS